MTLHDALAAEALTIGTDATLAEGLRRLESAPALVLIDADGRPLREVRAFHLRRMGLAGFGPDTPLAALPPGAAPVAVGEAEARNPQALMRERGLQVLALTDAAGRVRRVAARDRRDERILLSPPHMGGEEEALALSAFETNWIAPLGPNVDAFEAELAAYLGAPAAAALSSGTAALHLALRLLDVGPGDVVLTSSLTFIGSVAPILYQGAAPVFIDSAPDSWNMSPAALERALARARAEGVAPKAAIVTNIYGQSADLDPILALCAAHGVPVIEDAAESLGADYKGRKSGTLGMLGAFSFNGNKIITTSGGGALTAHDPDLVARARFFSTQARDPAPHYEHTVYGYNYRMSNILAGVGRAQLRLLDDRVARRRRIFARYREALADVPAIGWMPEAATGRCNRWLTVATIDPDLGGGATPASVIAALAAAGVEARPVWKPMHRQPLFAGAAYTPHDDALSFSDLCFARGLCLPSGSDLSDDQIARVADLVRRAIG